MQVLVVSGDPRFAEWLVGTLGAAGWNVRTTATPDSSLVILDQWPTRLVITDERARSLTPAWVEACRAAGGRLVVVTPRTIDGELEASLAAGADGFVQCPVGSHELIARLRAVSRRGVPPRVAIADRASLKLGELVLDRRSGQVAIAGRPVPLPTRELQILEALMLASPNVVSRDDLVRRVFHDSPAAANLDLLVRRIRTRLEAEEGWRRVDTVRGVGFRLLAQEPSPDGRPAFTEVSAPGHGPFGLPREPVAP